MAWSEDWTIENVEQNYLAIGMVDPDDIVQLIKDSKELLVMKHEFGDPKSLAKLREKAEKFEACQAAGVDNWEGWDYAMSLYNGEEEDE